jgi:hypothetical protein
MAKVSSDTTAPPVEHAGRQGLAASVPPELLHFIALTQAEQTAAICRLAAQGLSERGIAAATRLSVEQIRRVLPAGAAR